jgi:hypothetical protein
MEVGVTVPIMGPWRRRLLPPESLRAEDSRDRESRRERSRKRVVLMMNALF